MSYHVKAKRACKYKYNHIGRRIETLLGCTYPITNITSMPDNKISFHLGAGREWKVNENDMVLLTMNQVVWENNWRIESVLDRHQTGPYEYVESSILKGK